VRPLERLGRIDAVVGGAHPQLVGREAPVAHVAVVDADAGDLQFLRMLRREQQQVVEAVDVALCAESDVVSAASRSMTSGSASHTRRLAA
jgi:hypothetical protein